jgi:hypothetical protein
VLEFGGVKEEEEILVRVVLLEVLDPLVKVETLIIGLVEPLELEDTVKINEFVLFLVFFVQLFIIFPFF